MKKIIALICCAVLAIGLLAGCSQKPDETKPAEDTTAATTKAPETTPEETTPAEEEDEEDYTTGDASKDDPLNADGIGEQEILVVSFGTSFNDSRVENIGGIEKAIAAAFPDYDVRRAFTSNIIIDHVQRRDGEVIDDLKQGLDRAVSNGVKTLIVQPTHLMSGFEYNDILDEIAGYADQFEQLSIGKNILDTDRDFKKVMNIITAATAQYDDGETAIIFMGHGTEAESNGVYAKLQGMLTDAGYANYFIGTVEAEPSLEDVVKAAKDGGYKKVVLEPLMIVAGDHANNDMAGDEEDSWKSVFQSEGFEVECVLKGLGSMKEIQDILVAHTQNAIDMLDEDYETGDASKDDALNADGIGETELLVVSFGTSFNDSRVENIGGIEKAMIAAFPEVSVRRAFTSNIIINNVERRDGEIIDDLTEALDRAVDNGVKNLIVQPTHLMAGLEYGDIVDEIASYADQFESVVIGKNILDTDDDFKKVMEIITKETKQYDDGQTAIVFMGHGTEAESNAVYAKMQDMLKEAGYKNYYIGTVEAEPSLEDVVKAVKDGGYKKVVLEPLMIVAGDHANNDMAGEEEDSWKTVFQNEGFEVECVLRGLGSMPDIQQILVDHAKAAMEELNK